MTDYRGRRPGDPDYGVGEHTIDVDRLHLIDEAELTAQLVRTFAARSYRPPRLPAVATEILELSRQSDVSFKEIEELLEQDAMLAGEVLAVARSAFYSGTRPVQTLQAALVRIGLERLREIMLEVALKLRVFRSESYRGCMERLRLHCQATANLSRIMSRYSPVTQDRAFLCGLLHDVGIAGILLVLGDVAPGRRAPDLIGLWPAIHAAHGRAGARMVGLWNLPTEVAGVIAAHHEVPADGDEAPMTATVCLAEELTAELGLGLVPPPGESNPDIDASGLTMHPRVDRSEVGALDRARRTIGLDDATAGRVREEARAWAETASLGEAR